MKRKVLFIALTVFLLVGAATGMQAQDKGVGIKELVSKGKIKIKKDNKDDKDDKNDKNDKNPVIDSLQFYKDLVVALTAELDERDSIAIEKMGQMEAMKEMMKEDSIKIFSFEAKEKELMQAIENKDKEIAVLRSKEAAVDSGILRLANRLLFEKFDKAAVEDGMEFFSKICTGDLKEKYSIVMELLTMYEGVYLEYQRILKKAQNDGDRTDAYSFAIGPYKSKYIEMLKSMPYYKSYCVGDADWCIVYLNMDIEKALRMLEKHSKDSPADFSSMIDPRF